MIQVTHTPLIFKISDPYVLPDMKNHLLYKHIILIDSA